METKQEQEQRDMEKLKEIPKWTRKYGQNRTLTNFAMLIISLLIFMGIGGSSLLAGMAAKTGHQIFFWICITVLFAIMIFLFYLSIPKFGGIKIWKWVERRIYGQEGLISMPEPEGMKKNEWLDWVVALMFGLCVLGTVHLGERYIPIDYLQPVSALYLVPFLVFLYFRQRSKMSVLMLLWPVFYAIHAILIVAGAPILFTGNLTGLNMLLPVFGYGALSYIIAYFYGRYALKKLKSVTHLAEGKADEV